ncbi:unnamed protein product [Vicia faba]|uniref:RRM domain-containing protein n=1 Tax=Vicia faba TaxID=3906 RepID=A0AAV1AL47_VICFA|nr:unnamed protein product [Vicia faba]
MRTEFRGNATVEGSDGNDAISNQRNCLSDHKELVSPYQCLVVSLESLIMRPHTQGSQSEGDSNNTTIFVGGLDSEISDEDLRQPFLQYGDVVSVKIPIGKGCGFVQLADRKNDKDTMQECVSEFISFITSEASEKCQKEKRKTINGDDLLWAMATLGFEDYIEPLKVYLAR